VEIPVLVISQLTANADTLSFRSVDTTHRNFTILLPDPTQPDPADSCMDSTHVQL